MSSLPIQRYRMYPGGDTVAEVMENMIGEDKAHTVCHALETAASRFDSIADEMRGAATAIVCDGDTSQGPLHMVLSMVTQFDKQAADTREVLALLRGDGEEQDDPPASYLDGVDGHWYVCRYDRTLPQIHAVDCNTCAQQVEDP